MSAIQGCPLNRVPLYSQTTDVKPPSYTETKPTQIHGYKGSAHVQYI